MVRERKKGDDYGMQFRTFPGQELAKGAVTRNTAARLWCNRERGKRRRRGIVAEHRAIKIV